MKIRLVGALLISALAVANAQPPGRIATACAQGGAQFSVCASSWLRVLQSGGALTDTIESFNAGTFEGLIDGVSMSTMHQRWCPTSPVASDQLRAVVATWVIANPAQWNKPITELIVIPISQAYPCGRR